MKKHIEAIQRGYPQIYLACHADHVKAKSTEYQLSARDSTILSHLHEDRPLTASVLAAHLGVQASTFSAAIKGLIELGYTRKTANPSDRREAQLTLTRLGATAMAATSVLDASRVADMLAELEADDLVRAVEGLRLLADAALRLQLKMSKKEKIR
ncbi:MAG: MarR family winged helix-turn-helix transcriptional regulator [Tahibacter sp.]